MDNREVIFDIVSNHFCLEEESLERFLDALYEPYIDPTYKKILGENSLRKEIPVDDSVLEKIDYTWADFKNRFKSFCLDTKLSYSDYRNNLVLVGKNKVKILKAVSNYYLEKRDIFEREIHRNYGFELGHNPDESHIKEFLKTIYTCLTENKFPKAGIKVVLSLDYADWFLCSTGNSWGSCLDFEGQNSFWVGLPGIISDKNRAMLYVTSGEKKNKYGIVVDKALYRSWVLVDEKNDLFLCNWYPDNFLKSNQLSDLFGHRFYELNCYNTFVSKHSMDFLFFKSKRSAYIYKDNFYFDDDFYLSNRKDDSNNDDEDEECESNSIYGFSTFDKNVGEIVGGDSNLNRRIPVLSTLIREKTNWIDFHGILKECHHCRQHVRTENLIPYKTHSYGTVHYCKKCYEEVFVVCHHCGKKSHSENMMHYRMNDKDVYYCQECHSKMSFCAICGNPATNKGEKHLLCDEHLDFLNNSACQNCVRYRTNTISNGCFFCNRRRAEELKRNN
jgi:hypothetical protein